MNSETLLLRNVHPIWIQQGRVTSQAFTPTTKDEGKLSVYNGDKWPPADCFDHFTNQGLDSVGVLGIQRDDCVQSGLDVHEDNIPFEGHCFIDFGQLSKTAAKKIGKTLSRKAFENGWLYFS